MSSFSLLLDDHFILNIFPPSLTFQYLCTIEISLKIISLFLNIELIGLQNKTYEK